MSNSLSLNEIPTKVVEALSLSAIEKTKLAEYVALLLKWQKAINLIGPKTIDDIWTRHILDSGQLRPFLDPLMEEFPAQGANSKTPPLVSGSQLADVGSGAGLPGLVLSILGVPNIHLVESDGRKAAFLNEAVRLLSLDATVLNDRAENLPVKEYSLITARAFAALPTILQISFPLLKTGGKLLILKGKTVDEELTACEKDWNMRVIKQPSITDPGGTVLLISDVEPLHD